MFGLYDVQSSICTAWLVNIFLTNYSAGNLIEIKSRLA